MPSGRATSHPLPRRAPAPLDGAMTTSETRDVDQHGHRSYLNRWSLTTLSLVLCCFLSDRAIGEDGSGDAPGDLPLVEFERDIAPILNAHCIECHGQKSQRSSLRLDLRASALLGGDMGEPSIVPGDSEASLLIQAIRGDHPDLRMPPKGASLDKSQIGLLTRWIDQGAVWTGQMESSDDDNATPFEKARLEHWSFQPVKHSSQEPASETIDSFIRQKLQEKGLTRSRPADPAKLLRRVTLVLTGLPPNAQEMQRFLTDPNGVESAYESAVDRLLSSPHYGERWAQHWLDVIRWAETVGFETNLERRNAWPYRDWVIEAFNDDKPYNEFIIEQLTGDLSGQDASLGFLVSGPANLPGQIGRDQEAMRQARQDELDEVIGTVSQSILGLTIRCARCHNHKFDPILQRDYYAMQAIFSGLSYGERRLRGEQNDQWSAQVPDARDKLNSLREQLEKLRIAHRLKEPLSDLHTDSFDASTIDAVRMNIDATTNGGAASLYEFQIWTAEDDPGDSSRNVALRSAGAKASASSYALQNQTRHPDNLIDGSTDRRQAFPWVAASAGPAWIEIDLAKPERVNRITWDRGNSSPSRYTLQIRKGTSDPWITIADSRDRLPRIDETRSPDQIALTNVDAKQVGEIMAKIAEVRRAQNELSRLSAGPKVYAASFVDRPEPTWLLGRGDPMQRRGEVTPAVPSILGDLRLSVESSDQERRMALAKHLTDPDHPLTSRVIVNRVWQHHFGVGLIDTPSDLGRMGSEPSHPELLDSLASSFVSEGWSLKRLHRRIVLSDTFRQSSHPEANALQVDAESRLLWRYPPRRLEAEAIRDSILAVAGKLNTERGGPGFNLFRQRGGLSGFTPIETFDESGWRRMIYAHKIRMQEVDVFGAFDCPDAGQMKPRRTRSITPNQSLGLLNSPFMLRQSEFLATRITQEAGDSFDAQLTHAFQLTLGREPIESERESMAPFLEQHGLAQLCRVLLNTSEFLWIQ